MDETKNNEQKETEIETPLEAVNNNALKIVHVASQTKIIHFRSKSVQVNMALTQQHASTSPMKITISETKISSQKRLRFDSEQSTVDEIENTKSAKEESDFKLERISPSSSSSEAYYKVEKDKSKQFRKTFIKIIERKLRMYTGIPKIHLQLIDSLQARTGLKRHSIYLILYKIKSNESFAKIGDFFEISIHV